MSTRRAAEGFEAHHSERFGPRWPILKAALLEEGKKFQLENPFWQEGSSLERFYHLDPASVRAADALPLVEGGRHLDLCAAPGGKALTAIFRAPTGMSFILNDSSRDRVKRLKAVLHDFLPPEKLSQVRVTNHVGERWGLHEQEAYDSVLVDAPCSGERHLLKTPAELKIWSPNRSKGLAQRQFALLCSALETVKVGGHILYSTCSIESLENDLVIRRLLERRAGRVEVVKEPEIFKRDLVELAPEKTDYGAILLPDRSAGGPIYYCLLKRLS